VCEREWLVCCWGVACAVRGSTAVSFERTDNNNNYKRKRGVSRAEGFRVQQMHMASNTLSAGKKASPGLETTGSRKPFVIQFGWKRQNFWKAELDGVLKLAGVLPETVYCAEDLEHVKSPFVFATFPSVEVAHFVCERCVLVTRVYHLWGTGRTDEELHREIQHLDDRVTGPCFSAESSWSIQVDAFGKRLNMGEQEKLRKKLAFIPFEGPVKLKKPDNQFWYIEEYNPQGVPCNQADTRNPIRKFFLLEIAHGRSDLVVKYSLKSRKFLGPTSMDTEFAFIMANCALARPGSFIFDPFVGTGSLLIAAKVFGAVCLGTDIDIRMLHAKRFRKTNDLFSNYEQYGLEPPCTVRADMSQRGNCLRQVAMFDGIIADPPYGVRAGARKCGSKDAEVKKIPEHRLHDHIPQTQPYHGTEVMLDLLNFSAKYLVLGGRLVYFLPVEKDIYTVADVPNHDCLSLISNCEDPLASAFARRLITMEKVAEPVDSESSIAYYSDGREHGTLEPSLRQKIELKGIMERDAKRPKT
jgi:tRNA (guanine10-N2)-methyltransferase